MDKTGWSPATVRKYMKYQFDMVAHGRLDPKEVGGFGYALPAKSADGQPADLPPEVQIYLKSGMLSRSQTSLL